MESDQQARAAWMAANESGPSAVETYGFAWSELKLHFVELLLIGIVWMLVLFPAGAFERSGAHLLSSAYHLLVLGPVSFGGMYAYLRAARSERPEVSDLFVAFQQNYLNAVLANLLLSALITIGFCLLIVPGIIAAVRLAFVPYLVIDEKLDAVESVLESWRRTAGHGWTIFALWLIAIPIVLVGLLLVVVGVIPALIWIQLAAATFYAAITARLRAAQRAVTDIR
jgi:uncharacterized membrane protein